LWRKIKPPKTRAIPSTSFDPENVTVLADNGGVVPLIEAFPLSQSAFATSS